jgi:hypothetical protein
MWITAKIGASRSSIVQPVWALAQPKQHATRSPALKRVGAGADPLIALAAAYDQW